jgi:hypothetical protein
MRWPPRSRSRLSKDILVALAGPAAVRRVNGGAPPSVDEANARRLIARIPPLLGEDEVSRLIRFEAEAAALVSAHWPAIVRVALALAEHRTLDAAQVRAVIEATP